MFNRLALPENAIEQIKNYLLQLQNTICQTLENLDGKALFLEDQWTRPEGGGGITRTLNDGALFEKAGVNFSHVSGDQLPASSSASRPELAGKNYTALGVSLVIHPDNPYIPTTHANVRFFHAQGEEHLDHWWFGGGFDLTPYYGFTEDCQHWHQTAKAACLPFGDDLYSQFKNWADQYFFLAHRNEARGIGGLFFDDYHKKSFEDSFNFMKSVGDHFLKAYIPIVKLRKDHPFSQENKAFQNYRRGRYVEYNLIYDRGTRFGLHSGGRTESILMSLPPHASWVYNWKPQEGSEEAKLYTDFLPVRDWL